MISALTFAICSRRVLMSSFRPWVICQRKKVMTLKEESKEWRKSQRKGFLFVFRCSQNIQLVDLQDDEGNQIVKEFTSEYVFKYPPNPVTFRIAMNWINPIENGIEGGVETLEWPTLIWGPQPARQTEKTVTYSKDQFTHCILHLIHMNWAV